MGKPIFEHTSNINDPIEEYLSNSIIDYGKAQLNDELLLKLYCSCKSNQGELLGAVMGTKTINLFFISHIFVDKEYRRKGIGTKLLSQIEIKAKNIGCNIFRLNTFNNLSHNFYLNNGYSETTRINSYMSGFDLVYYEKAISQVHKIVRYRSLDPP